MPGMTSGSSKWQKSRHSSYLYPLWRFLSKIGCPVFGSWAGAALHKIVACAWFAVGDGLGRLAGERWSRGIGELLEA